MRKAKLFTLRLSMIRAYVLFLLASGISLGGFAQVDCPPVTVFCQDIHTTFMPDACMVEVWAKDFINKINSPETSLDDFIISFEEDSEKMSEVFESMNGNDYDVTIWITSRCDTSLKTRCIVRLEINDNTNDCPTGPCPIDVSPWCGYAVVTCTTVQGTPTEMTGHTAAIVDTRKNSKAPKGDNWSRPVQSAEDPVAFIRPNAWRINQIGNVFGIALNPNSGDIYLAASDVYDYDFQNFVTVGPPPPSVKGPAGSGGIYISNFANPEATNVLVATTSSYPSPANFNSTVIGTNVIPNTGNIAGNAGRSGNGIGNIDYDLKSNNIFASNLEDGKLYSINSTSGMIVDVHDPFGAYVHSVGMVQQSERIWGVAVDDCSPISRLFFARAARTPSTTPDVIDPKEVWSIAINPDGTFSGTERIEFILERGDQSKITDLGFSVQCHEIILAERGNAHSSEVNRFRKQADESWQYNKQFFLGINAPDNTNPDYPTGIRGNSAAGGVSYGSSEEGCVIDFDCNGLVWGTTNCGDIAADDTAITPTPFECAIYGAQGISKSGNSPLLNKSTDIFIGFDTTATLSNIQFKSNIGDIEIFNCCCIDDEGRNTPNVEVSAMIAGEVYTEQNNRIKDTKVAVRSASMERDIMTNAQGEYIFEDLSMHSNYDILPEKKGDILDGISTLDFLLIQKHILGLSKLKSPYKIIAADIDNNNKVSAMDLVILRRLILGLSSGEEYNTWSFVPVSYTFENQFNPFPYDNSISLNDLEENAMHEDFIAIKMGDVNGDNRFNFKSNPRSELSALLHIEKINGQVYVSLNKDIKLSGLQFELLSENGRLTNEISSGFISVDNSNYSITDNNVKFSWSSISAIQLSKGDVLFSFKLNSPEEDHLRLGEHTIDARAYDSDLASHTLSLVKTQVDDNTKIIGNSPNPFRNKTNITFDLKESQEVSFEFYSVDGKLLYNITDSFNKGRNNIEIDANDLQLNSSNIIIYKMNTNNYSYIGKMIQIYK